MDEDCRCRIEHGLDDEIGAVDVRCANDLNVCSGGAVVLTHERCHILINVGSQDSLDHEHMVMTLQSLHHAEIIDVTVVVEIEVGEHVGVIVEKVLELLDSI